MSQKSYTKYNSQNEGYIQGSAARKLSAVPVIEPQKRDRRDDEQRRKEQKLQHREYQAAHRINFLYTMAVVGVLAFVFTICIQYLELQSTVKNNALKVSRLELELNDVSTANNMAELEINGNIDYDAILNTAMGELGMVYPKKNQVVNYLSKESEYVIQYSNIPGAE